MLSTILEQAILQTQKATLIPQLDIMTHYANLNLAVDAYSACNGDLIEIDGELKKIQSEACIYYRNVLDFTIDRGFHQVAVSTVIFNIPFSENIYKYIRQSLGSHNDTNRIDHYFSDKKANMLLPFDVITTALTESIPSNVDIKDAFGQNPHHPCFHHRLIPAPVAGVAVHSKLESLMGFIVHPKLLIDALQADLTEEGQVSLQYDTKIALNLLNLRYGISINKEVIEALDKLDADLIKINGTAYIDIEGEL